MVFEFSQFLLASYTVKGNIKNIVTKEPLEGVNIFIKDLRKGTISNREGDFSLIIDNEYEAISGLDDVIIIEFSHIAYETVRWSGSPNKFIELEMKEVLLKLDDIVVTSMKSEYFSSDVPVFTEIINNEEIRSASAITIGELMEERAGVSRVYNFDGSFNYNLIGLDSKYILILKDGQPITGKFNDKVDLDQITTANVEKIEILKGPGSALYGTEAMGGIINIITKDSNSSANSQIKVRGINYNSDLKDIASNPIGGDLSYDFLLPFRSYKIYSTVVLQKLVNGKKLSSLGKDKIDKINFDGGISWRSNNEKQNIKLGLSYFERVDSSKEKTSTGLEVKSSSTNIKRNNITLDYKLFYNEKYSFSQSINLNSYTRIYNQTGIDESFYKNDETKESLIDYDSKFNFSNDKYNLTGGFEFSRPTYNSNRVNGGSHYSPTYGQFFQLSYNLSRLYTFIGGLRFDNYESTKITSPRVAFLIKPNADSKIRLSYGEGFRIPSFLEMFIDFDNIDNGYTVMGNENLEPEKSKGITINYEYTNNRSIRFNVLSYFNYFSNKIETIDQEMGNSNGPIIYKYENLAEANYRGAEFSISYLKSSNTSFKINFNARKAIDGDGQELPKTIPYSIGSQLNYNLSKYATRITFNSSSNYRSDDQLDPDDLDDQLYHLLNIRLNYNINQNLSTNIGVKNITNYTHKNGPYVGRSIYFEIIKQ